MWFRYVLQAVDLVPEQLKLATPVRVGLKIVATTTTTDDDRNLLTESMNVSAQPENKNSIKTCLAANREGELYDFGTKSGFRWRQRQLRLRLFGMEQSKGPEFRP